MSDEVAVLRRALNICDERRMHLEAQVTDLQDRLQRTLNQRGSVRLSGGDSLPVPSDEAVELVAQAISEARKTPDHKRSRQRAKKALAKVYAIDAPRLRAEAAAEARAATLREVEALRERLSTMNECVRIYIDMREASTPARPGWLEEEVAATDASLAHFNPEANE